MTPNEMEFLQGKTPMSFLQELCTKNGFTLQYDLIASEGTVHEPTFIYKVITTKYIGMGKGSSKKRAMHNAALSVLTDGQMVVIDDQTPGTKNTPPPINTSTAATIATPPSATESQDSDDSLNLMVRNPISELQELTQKHLFLLPIYEFSSEQGPLHAPEFACNVRLWNLSGQGVGSSKKKAKRNAANSMLQLLKQDTITRPATDPSPIVNAHLNKSLAFLGSKW